MSDSEPLFRATQVSELMTPNPEALHADATIGDALALMERRRFRHVPIVDEDRIVIGILSQRDILRLVWPTGDPNQARRLTESALIRDVMQAEVATIAPSDSVSQAARYMLRSKRDSLPVVGEGGHLVGILTCADFLREIVRNSPPDIPGDEQDS